MAKPETLNEAATLLAEFQTTVTLLYHEHDLDEHNRLEELHARQFTRLVDLIAEGRETEPF